MELTKTEIKILLTHFERDYHYGVGGTWGDGDEWTGTVAQRITGDRIIKKLERELANRK